ncbi:uncharacterized protein MONOS_4389 [Monocercomonoides exilis]|uniref:uncharacterized protein n=1 Tax=Monocercomonoides exilis TaxID=2049356 RepID=UPI00355AA6D7|nr:hypothetical protein MONOS_4389 [Monocercomonoides exilis]|eukprot:MONOS_4389.1-p1 / transcript=MONOS_4389.1 / gene=MONOS_4389 / organism=Monocercomonoides_exilis_PA203 / gene_product=unspecified product / transcript_product=unspecified product / location=Mono_scaffold00116:88368-91151(+) / protein_length=597 / sequence_SO=supercontig / SO=protein_coding / is_pseudo=false
MSKDSSQAQSPEETAMVDVELEIVHEGTEYSDLQTMLSIARQHRAIYNHPRFTWGTKCTATRSVHMPVDFFLEAMNKPVSPEAMVKKCHYNNLFPSRTPESLRVIKWLTLLDDYSFIYIDIFGRLRCFVFNPPLNEEERIKIELRREWFEHIPPVPKSISFSAIWFQHNSIWALTDIGQIITYGKELDADEDEEAGWALMTQSSFGRSFSTPRPLAPSRHFTGRKPFSSPTSGEYPLDSSSSSSSSSSSAAAAASASSKASEPAVPQTAPFVPPSGKQSSTSSASDTSALSRFASTALFASSLGFGRVQSISPGLWRTFIILENGAVFCAGFIYHYQQHQPFIPEEGLVELTDSAIFSPTYSSSLCGRLQPERGRYGLFGDSHIVRYISEIGVFISDAGLVFFDTHEDRTRPGQPPVSSASIVSSGSVSSASLSVLRHSMMTPVDRAAFFDNRAVIDAAAMGDNPISAIIWLLEGSRIIATKYTPYDTSAPMIARGLQEKIFDVDLKFVGPSIVSMMTVIDKIFILLDDGSVYKAKTTSKELENVTDKFKKFFPSKSEMQQTKITWITKREQYIFILGHTKSVKRDAMKEKENTPS